MGEKLGEINQNKSNDVWLEASWVIFKIFLLYLCFEALLQEHILLL